MNIPTQERSNDKTAELLRILMPVIIIILLVVIAKSFFGSIFSGIGGIAEGLNIKNTAEENAAIKNANDKVNALNNSSNNPFDATYFQKYINTNPLTGDKAQRLAWQIKGSVGTFYDSPEEAIAAIKQCVNKAQVSQVAFMFYNYYKTDMLNWLNLHFDTAAQKTALTIIINYVNNLPSGTK